MQTQNQAVNLEGDLPLVGVGSQMLFLPGQHDGAVERAEPGLHRSGQRVAHRSRSVVKLDRTADEDAARLQFERHPLHPVGKQGAQTGQTARLGQGGLENLFFKAPVILAYHRDLQLLARAEVRKHTRLAHVHHLGQSANGQPLEPNLRSQCQSRIHDGRLGLLPLGLKTRR